MNIPTFIFQDWDTALQKAARRGQLEMSKFLLELSSIDPNQTNVVGLI